MDTETGKVLHFEDEVEMQKFVDESNTNGAKLVPLRQTPKPNCRKCYGRGHIGKNLKTGLFIPCKCCA